MEKFEWFEETEDVYDIFLTPEDVDSYGYPDMIRRYPVHWN